MVAQPKPIALQATPVSVPPGAGFLLDPACSREVFTSERFSEEQRAFYKTAVDFVEKEVVPHHEDIEHKNKGQQPAQGAAE